jgi:hypothetical protein
MGSKRSVAIATGYTALESAGYPGPTRRLVADPVAGPAAALGLPIGAQPACMAEPDRV